MDSPDSILSSLLEDGHPSITLQPAGPDHERRRSTAPSRSSPATSDARRLSRTRTIRSAHRPPQRRHNLERLSLKPKRLHLDRNRASFNYHKGFAHPAESEHSTWELPSYEQLFFPEAVPIPRKPSLSDLASGLLYRRAAKYTHGIDTGKPATAHPVITADMAAALVNSIGRAARTAAVGPTLSKDTITVDTRPVKEGRTLMSGNGISCSFSLAEPVVYLTGFRRDGHEPAQENPSTIIRGKFILDVQKSVKIKAVTVRFFGIARTEWPEGEFHVSQVQVRFRSPCGC